MERRILLVAFFYLLQLGLKGQVCEWAYTRSYSSSNMVNCIGSDAQGNAYLSAKFTSVGWGGGPGGWIMSKLTPQGEHAWTDTLHIVDLKISTDAQGEIYAAGGFYNSFTLDSFTLTANGYNSFIARFDSSGKCRWIKQLHLIGPEDITVMPGGGFCIAGKNGKDSTVHFDNYTLTGKAFFVARYDDAGHCQWVKDVPYAYYGSATVSVTTDMQGNVYAAAPGSPAHNGELGFAIKYDAVGNEQWVAPVPAFPSDISVDESGNVLLTGYFSRTTTFGLVTYTADPACYSSFVMKFDNKGNSLWAKVFQGNYGPAFTSIAAGINGSFYITGSFYKTAVIGDTTISTEDPDVFNGNQLIVARFDENGGLAWLRHTRGVGGTYPPECIGNALCADRYNGALYVGGQAGDTTIYENTLIKGGSYSSLFLLRVKDNQVNGIEQSTPLAEAGLDIFPNPGKGLINFKYDQPSPGNVSLRLYNTAGDLILSHDRVQVKGMEGTLDLQDQAPGVYLIEMNNGTNTTVRRVVIEK